MRRIGILSECNRAIAHMKWNDSLSRIRGPNLEPTPFDLGSSLLGLGGAAEQPILTSFVEWALGPTKCHSA